MTAAVSAGVLNIAFAVFHLMFWRLFNWPERLPASGAVNAAITQTFNWLGIYMFTVYGAALIWLAMQPGGVPPVLALAGAGFWIGRTVLQLALFPMRNGHSAALMAVFVATTAAHLAAAV